MERLELMAEKIGQTSCRTYRGSSSRTARTRKRSSRIKNASCVCCLTFKKQAEEERKSGGADCSGKTEALKKQIDAMSEEKSVLESKALEAAALAEDVQALKAKMELLQRPWWQKWFSVQE